MSVSQKVPDETEHKAWVHDAIYNPRKKVFLYLIDDMPAGTFTTLVEHAGLTQIAYMVAPEWRKLGVGKKMISEALAILPQSTNYSAYSRPENVASRKILEANGFQLLSDKGELFGYWRSPILLNPENFHPITTDV